MSSRTRGLVLACAIACVAVLAARSVRYWVFTLDDAFITLRYAKHLAAGLGPSWNPGGAPAEGYTTTLWMAVCALAVSLGADGLWFAKLAGTFFAVAALATASRLAFISADPKPWPRAFAACTPWLFAIAYWPFALHAVSGMETTCSAFMLSAFFWLSVEAPQRGWWRALALTALAASLTRPEAVLVCGVTLLAMNCNRALLRAVALYTVLPGAIYYAWRFWQFGLLFPLSFYVKATGQQAFAGLRDVVEFFALFVFSPWWAVLAILGMAHALRPALLGALAFALFFVFPEHIMAFESRYLVPLVPLIAALAGIGVNVLMRRERLTYAAPAVLLLLCAIPTSAESNSEQWLDYGRGLTRAHVALGHALHDSGLRNARIAMLDVGAVGYYGDWFTLDTFGLNDAHVALTQRRDVDYVFHAKPDVLVLVSATPKRFTQVFVWEQPLYDEAAKRGYRYACDYEFEPDYQLQVYVQDARYGAVCTNTWKAALSNSRPKN